MFTVFLFFRLFALYCQVTGVRLLALLGVFFVTAPCAMPGDFDPAFGQNGVTYSTGLTYLYTLPQRLLSTPNHRLVAAGFCHPGTKFCFAAYTDDGAPDPAVGAGNSSSPGIVFDAFGPGENTAFDAALQADGKILIAGACNAADTGFMWRMCVARYLANGSRDSAQFAADGALPGVALIPEAATPFERASGVLALNDGKILVVGQCFRELTPLLCMYKLHSDGSVDTVGFNPGGANPGSTMIDFNEPESNVQLNGIPKIRLNSDGSILLAATCAIKVGQNGICLSRFTANGILDSAFGQGGIVRRPFATMSIEGTNPEFAIQPDGKIVVGGTCFTPSTGLMMCATRMLSDGQVDTTFFNSLDPVSPGFVFAKAGEYAVGETIALHPDGRIFLAGFCWDFGNKLCLLTLNSDGTLHSAAGQIGVRIVYDDRHERISPKSALIDDKGKLVIAGICERSEDSDRRWCLARFKGGPYNPLTCALNADANQTIDPATDALLLARYLLGFHGDALTAGVLGANPTRTGQALETYLASLNLDADGDGQALAMTDGLLILRAMLGLTGTALTQGATNASQPNVRNAQQILSWIESTHGVACLP
jgi:uncharacterized delta-60 repeat protein